MPRQLWSQTFAGRLGKARRNNRPLPKSNMPPLLAGPCRHELTAEVTDNDERQDLAANSGESELAIKWERLKTWEQILETLTTSRFEGFWIEVIVNPHAFDGRGITTKWSKEQYL